MIRDLICAARTRRLEQENAALRQEVDDLRADCSRLHREKMAEWKGHQLALGALGDIANVVEEAGIAPSGDVLADIQRLIADTNAREDELLAAVEEVTRARARFAAALAKVRDQKDEARAEVKRLQAHQPRTTTILDEDEFVEVTHPDGRTERHVDMASALGALGVRHGVHVDGVTATLEEAALTAADVAAWLRAQPLPEGWYGDTLGLWGPPKNGFRPRVGPDRDDTGARFDVVLWSTYTEPLAVALSNALHVLGLDRSPES